MERLTKILLILFLQVIITNPTLSIALASTPNQKMEIKDESINPGSIYYPLKRAWEKIRERIIFSPDAKITYHASLTAMRLSELNYVVEKDLPGEYQTSSERFAYQAGILVDDLIRYNKTDQKEKVADDFKSYTKVLELLRDKHPANTSFWMLIQHDINTLQILTQKLRDD